MPHSARGNPTTSQGEIVHEDYDVFGAPTPTTPPTDLTRTGFTGQQHDVDLGLIDMRGRVYDPLAGRFTTQDPVMQAPFWSQGLNPYSYVFNDPINHTDPSGFDSVGNNGGGIVGSLVVDGHVEAAGLAIQGFGGSIGGFALGAGANLGVSALVGDPFGGSGPKSQSVAAGAHTSNVKGGGSDTSAGGQTRPGVLGQPPSLHPPRTGPDLRLAEVPEPEIRGEAFEAESDFVLRPLPVDPEAEPLPPPLPKWTPPSINGYPICFEAVLTPRGVGTRESHFIEANEQLLRAMGEPELAEALRSQLGENFEGSLVTETGRVRGASPPEWTWHHVVPDEVAGIPEGRLWLVPREVHRPGSLWQEYLHPNRVGGFSIWGFKF